RLPFLLERIVRGNHHVGDVSGDIDVRRIAECDHTIGDAILFGVGVEVTRPLRAGSRTLPRVGREFIDDRCLLGAGRQSRLHVTLVETVNELVHGCHHRSPRSGGSLRIGGSLSRSEYGHNQRDAYFAHWFSLLVSWINAESLHWAVTLMFRFHCYHSGVEVMAYVQEHQDPL